MNRQLANELGSDTLLKRFERAAIPTSPDYADLSSTAIRRICGSLMDIASNHLDILNEMYGRCHDFAGLDEADDTGEALDRLYERQPAAFAHPATEDYHAMLRGAYVVEQRLARLKAVLASPTGGGLLTRDDLRSPDERGTLRDVRTPVGGLHIERALWATEEAIRCLVAHGPLSPAVTARHEMPRNAM